MMGFDCSCDGEPAEIYNAARHKAKKAYCCDECGGPIAAGETYERASMLYDGCWSDFMTCADCLSIRDYVLINIPCFCWLHGDMLSHAFYTVQEAAAYAPEETAGLRFGFLRRKVTADKARKAKRQNLVAA